MPNIYDQMESIPNKFLNQDGSITTFAGNSVSSANEKGAEMYKYMAPYANKFLNPDGTITALSGGGGSDLEPRVEALENTIGNLNDSLEAVLNGE